MLNKYIDDIPFLVTRQVKEMGAVCHGLIETREMGVVYGDPGVGKTITAEQIALCQDICPTF